MLPRNNLMPAIDAEEQTTFILISFFASLMAFTFLSNNQSNPALKRLLALMGLFSQWQSINAQTPPNVSLSNLVMYLPFNGDLQDYSANNNHALGFNNPEFYVGKVDQALLCKDSAYARGDASKLPTKERTISLWFYPFSVDHATLFSYGGSGVPSTSYVLALNPGGKPSVDYNFYTIHPYGSGIDAFKAYYGAPAGGVTPLSGWHHWVTTTNATGTCHYINGEKEKCDPLLFFNTTAVIGTQYAICAAVNSAGIAPYSDANFNFFSGMIDELAVYKKALTESEVKQLFQLGGSKTTTLSSTAQITTKMIATTPARSTSNTETLTTLAPTTSNATATEAIGSNNTTNYIIGAAIGAGLFGSMFGAVAVVAGVKCFKNKKEVKKPVSLESNMTELKSKTETSDYSLIPPPAIVYESFGNMNLSN